MPCLNTLVWELTKGTHIGTVQFEESTASFLDNLVYGAPYKLLIPAFRRSGWSGAADVSDSFAAFLHLPRTKGKSERKQASGPLLRRYYDREHRRQAQQYTELLMLHQEAGTRPARYFTFPHMHAPCLARV